MAEVRSSCFAPLPNKTGETTVSCHSGTQTSRAFASFNPGFQHHPDCQYPNRRQKKNKSGGITQEANHDVWNVLLSFFPPRYHVWGYRCLWKETVWWPGTVSTALPFTHLVSPMDAMMKSTEKYQTGKIHRQAHPQCNLWGNIRSGRGERTQKKAIIQVWSRSYLVRQQMINFQRLRCLVCKNGDNHICSICPQIGDVV